MTYYNVYMYEFTPFRETKFYRHFFINKSYGGCPQDFGWLAVKDSDNFSIACDWDKHSTFPQFLYSRNGKITRWNNMGMIFFLKMLYNICTYMLIKTS